MRKLVLVLAVLALSACTTVGAVLTGSVANPITPKAAIQLHSGFVVAVVIPAAEYAALPRCSHAPAPCSQQAVVSKLRLYVNGADRTLKSLDSWALGNTSLDGFALYRAATLAITAATNYAAAQGVH